MSKFLERLLFIGVVLLAYSENIFATKYFGVIPYYVTKKAQASKIKLMLIQEEGIGCTCFNYSVSDESTPQKNSDQKLLNFIARQFCDDVSIFKEGFVRSQLSFDCSILSKNGDDRRRIFFLNCTELSWVESSVDFKMGIIVSTERASALELFTIKKLRDILKKRKEGDTEVDEELLALLCKSGTSIAKLINIGMSSN